MTFFRSTCNKTEVLGTNKKNNLIMKSSNVPKSTSFKAFILFIGFAISGLIVTESFGNKGEQIAQNGSYDSLENSIKNHKAIIMNTYLLGVSIYKEAFE